MLNWKVSVPSKINRRRRGKKSHMLKNIVFSISLLYGFVFSLIIENHLITQTVELMNHTDRIKTMIDTYNDEMVIILAQLPATISDHFKFLLLFQAYMAHQRQTLPTITLSPETRTCLDELNRPIISPLQARGPPSDFCSGKPKCYPKISKPVALEAICKSLSGLLRVKGFHGESKLDLVLMERYNNLFPFLQIVQKAVSLCSWMASMNS